jgi:hypothetical protein
MEVRAGALHNDPRPDGSAGALKGPSLVLFELRGGQSVEP